MAPNKLKGRVSSIFEPPSSTHPDSNDYGTIKHQPNEEAPFLDNTPSLKNLFEPINDKFTPPTSVDDSEPQKVFNEKARCSSESIKSTIIGSIVFLLYHLVFCLAQASTIVRPHATTPIIGSMAKLAALGILSASPVFIFQLGQDVPAIYPTSDLFLAPFLANLADTIDTSLYEAGLEDNASVFLATFCALSGAGLFLSGFLCLLAARVKLANLGAFLPYSVLCGFFTAIGLLMWTLSFSVDTGMKVGQVFRSGDTELISNSLVHHAPSFIVGCIMFFVGPKNPLYVIFLVFATAVVSYAIMFVTGTSLEEAQEMEWFWSVNDLVEQKVSSSGFGNWEPPAPFGVWNAVFCGKVHWGAFMSGIPTATALAFLYLIRCSLHAAALKKNVPNVTRNAPPHSNEDAASSEKKDPPTLLRILECGYGYSQFAAAFAGSIPVAPAVAASLTMFKLGAEGNAPQYGSVALVVIFYATDFQLVQYIPKAAFSCLLVLAFLDMTSTWIFKSYAKTRNKWEWSIAPIIVVLSFCIGMLNAIFVGIAFSTFIFVGSFYRSGVVKFLGTGLILRSTTERSYRETSWLDQNGDLLQIVVLQNYLFFGNSQSLYYYIQTMFEDVDDQIKFDSPLPPKPKYLIVDFTIVTGIDTSAVDLIRETIDLCRINQCRLFITGLSKDLRLTLIYSGVKADRTISFVSDLERALSKAEDGLLNNVLHIKEQDVQIAGSRQRSRSVSNSDDGFRYALKKIDEQHHLNYADKLSDLEKSTTVIELKNGEALFRDEGGRIDDSERGFFFIEFGRMRIEQDAHSTLARQTGKGTQSSIGRLNARAPVFGHQASRLKEQSRRAAEADSGAQFFRLARIGQGHVVGSIEACSGLRSQGQHIAETACRLHHLPYHKVKQIENENPQIVLHLFRLVSHLSARRQELTIEQLAQLVAIMNAPSPRKPMTRASLANLRGKLV